VQGVLAKAFSDAEIAGTSTTSVSEE